MQDKREDKGISGDPTDEATDTAEINEDGGHGCACCGEAEECHIKWAPDD